MDTEWIFDASRFSGSARIISFWQRVIRWNLEINQEIEWKVVEWGADVQDKEIFFAKVGGGGNRRAERADNRADDEELFS